jgi:hypothetical protein
LGGRAALRGVFFFALARAADVRGVCCERDALAPTLLFFALTNLDLSLSQPDFFVNKWMLSRFISQGWEVEAEERVRGREENLAARRMTKTGIIGGGRHFRDWAPALSFSCAPRRLWPLSLFCAPPSSSLFVLNARLTPRRSHRLSFNHNKQQPITVSKRQHQRQTVRHSLRLNEPPVSSPSSAFPKSLSF